jgi:hypothetical protein
LALPGKGINSSMSVTRISLPGVARSAHEARDRLGALLGSWRNESARDKATLLMSEVVTNAIRHVPGRTILITMTVMDGYLRAEVHDESTSLPIRHAVGERGGWGLQLLDLLSDQWGVQKHPGEGKTVWFEVRDAPTH